MQRIRRFLLPLLAVSMIAGSSVDGSALTQDETQFYVHWVGCGSGESELFLDPQHPGSAVNGCGAVGGAPLNFVYETTGEFNTIVREFPTRGGTPLMLDADRPVTGEVRVHRWTGTGSGVGQVQLEGILRARIDNKLVELGRFDGEQLAMPNERHVRFPFEIALDGSHTGATAAQLKLDVIVRGVHMNSGVIVTEGLSYVTVPTLVPEE